MQKVIGNITRGILFVVLLIGAFVLRARANAVLCQECYGTPTVPAYCADKENGRIKHGTCKPKDKISCTGTKCGSEFEEEEDFDAENPEDK